MTKRKGRRGKKKRMIKAGILTGVIVACAVAVGIIVYTSVFAPSKKMADLDDYYNLNGTVLEDGTTVPVAASNELAVVLENDITSERAVLQDGKAYVRYGFIRENIDDRFYYDYINNIVIVTNATQLITANAGEQAYSVNGSQVALDHPVSVVVEDEVYISSDFMDEFSSAHSAVYDNPRRLVINFQTGTFKVADVKSNTQLRTDSDTKSDIVADAAKGTPVTIIEEETDAGWKKVADDKGYIGYVKTSTLSSIEDEERASDYNEPEYTHIDVGNINMVWHNVYNTDANSGMYDMTENVQGINILSTRWYNLADTEGNVEILSDQDYVNYVHEKGWKMWALLDDVSEENAASVLADTNKRQNVINTIVEDVKSLGIDGINVDYEHITTESGDNFLEFIRELSLRCRNEGLVLSVDNYTPYSFNACYHIDKQSMVCDYVVVMAYDDYVGSDEIGPNSSTDFLQEVMDTTLPQVDEKRLVVALPFYSRFWIDWGDGNIEAQEMGMDETRNTVAEYGAEFTWDAGHGMNYASYTTWDGAQVSVWLEDAQSIQEKLNILQNYNIAGVSWWCLGQESQDVWPVISNYYQ